MSFLAAMQSIFKGHPATPLQPCAVEEVIGGMGESSVCRTKPKPALLGLGSGLGLAHHFLFPVTYQAKEN